MARRSKVVFCLLLAFLYVVVNICPLRAEALPDVMSGSTTLADNIMTYYALSGSAVANTDWINTLYNSYGSSFGTIEELAEQGYLVLNDAGNWEPVEQLGQMIEQAPAYSSLGLNEVFNVSAEEVAQGGGYAAASGASILAGSLGGVASTGVLPLFGGVTAAYWGGIGLGTLIAHKLGLYSKPIYYGLNMQFDEGYINNIPSGGSSYSYKSWGATTGYGFRISDPGLIGYCFLGNLSSSPNEGQVIVWNFYNYTDSKKYFYEYDFNNHTIRNTFYVGSKKHYSSHGTSYLGYTDGFTVIDSDKSNSELTEMYNSGDLKAKSKYSPDLISDTGNLTGSEDQNGNITVPDMKPQVDTGVQSGKPLTLQDWLNFANAVKNNNSQTDPFPNNQALFDNILDSIRENLPGQNPDPGGDPYSPPVITPVPDPSYPDPVPDQQITENPQESENPQQTEDPIDTGKPWRLPDLRQKFPFCIPWDIAKIFSKLKVNTRQAPHISWRFNPPNTPIDYTFNLDLEDFEEVAVLLRTLELMGFIVGLAFVTRYLIGAN